MLSAYLVSMPPVKSTGNVQAPEVFPFLAGHLGTEVTSQNPLHQAVILLK